MTDVTETIAPTQRQVYILAQLTDEELLLQAKADLLTNLAVDIFSVRDLPVAIGNLSRIAETIRVFREKTAKSAGRKLAPVVSGMFNDGGKGFCKKINYCDRRNELRKFLDKIRNAVSMAEVTSELVEIGEVLAAIIEALANAKLPLSVIFLILLYTLDEVCKCDS